ncbi:MAG: BatD family protein [Deltaproteobacteria bacterium]|nr:BatD family protein [Deltaproteobacteria bacterium]
MIGRIRNCWIFVIVFAVLNFCVSVHAAEIQAVVDRTQIGAGESIELTVTVKGGEGTVDISPIKDFTMMSGGTSTSVQIINGRMSKEVNHTYTLIPLKEGRLVIPPLSVTIDNTTQKTAEIVITVSPKTPEKTGGQDVFAEAKVSNSNPYEGEPIVYTFKLLSAIQIANARFQKPEFSGFTSKEVEKSQKTYRTVVNGREYSVTDLTILLVPVGAGPKTIDPAILECDLVRRQNMRRSPFGMLDDPFLGQNRLEPRVIRTEPLSITVKPLPPFNAKGQFSGLVGTFQIQSEVDKTTLNVGESATLSVNVSGTGNIMDAAAPEIAIPDAFKRYKDAPQEDIQPGMNGYTGKKVFRTALVPLKEGQYTLEPIAFNFFDVSSGQYQTRLTTPVSITVHPSREKDRIEVYSPPASDGKPLKKNVEFTGRDILPLKEDMNALETQKALSTAWFWALLLAPARLCLGVKGFLTFTIKKDDPSSLMAQRADQALKDASKPGISAEEFLTCLSRSLISILLSRAGVKGESLTYAEAETILKSGGFSEEAVKSATRLLEKIDSARFSGQGMDSKSREILLSETRELVRTIS